MLLRLAIASFLWLPAKPFDNQAKLRWLRFGLGLLRGCIFPSPPAFSFPVWSFKVVTSRHLSFAFSLHRERRDLFEAVVFFCPGNNLCGYSCLKKKERSRLPQPKGQGVVYRRSPSILPLSAEAFKQQDLHSLFGTVATLSWPLALPLLGRAKDVPDLQL